MIWDLLSNMQSPRGDNIRPPEIAAKRLRFEVRAQSISCNLIWKPWHTPRNLVFHAWKLDGLHESICKWFWKRSHQTGKNACWRVLLSACQIAHYCSADMSAGPNLTEQAVCHIFNQKAAAAADVASFWSMLCNFSAGLTVLVGRLCVAGRACNHGISPAATSIILWGRHFT